MKNYISKAQATRMSREQSRNYLRAWNRIDKPAKRQTWDDWFNGMKKSGEINLNADWTQPRFIKN